MTEGVELAFARFRRTGDPGAMARVYDDAAPEILRLATHMAPDPATAEDLVQATFLTAIQKAEAFHPGRRLMPWLVGILTNHAHDLRKRLSRRRDLDPLSAEVPLVPPLDAAEREEFTEHLDNAIDRLPDAYRPVLVLRLKHGMTPAEIAHALRRSPGTVRTQLARGLERLRGLLPASLASCIALWATPARGLAAIRQVVVGEAARIAATAGAASILGGLLVMKKILIAAGVVVTAAIGWWLWPDRPIEPPTIADTAAEPSSGDRAGNPPRTEPAEVPESARRPVRGHDTSSGRPWAVRGRIPVHPGVPISGAEVLAYPGEPGDQQLSFASLMDLSARNIFERPRSVLLEAQGDPIARTSVAHDGFFELRGVRERHLRLVARHRFYAFTQTVPVHRPRESATVELGPVDSFCGGHVLGRISGALATTVGEVRISLDPDPMRMLEDPQTFLANTSRGGTDRATVTEGRFEFRAVPPAAEIHLRLHADSHYASAPRFALAAGETLEVVLPSKPAASLAVEVVDENDAPLERALVRVKPLIELGDFSVAHLSSSASTDTAGRATLEDLIPGEYLVSAEHVGYRSARGSWAIGPEAATRARFVLEAGRSMRGRVVDASGQAIADAGIARTQTMEVPMLGDITEVTGTEAFARTARESRVRTDETGAFEIAGFPDAGQVAIVADHPDFVGAMWKGDVTDRPVEIVLRRPGGLIGRVVDASTGEPVDEFTVRTLVKLMMVFERPTTRTTVTGSEDGSFEVAEVPPGKFRMQIHAEGYGVFEQSIRLESEQQLDIGAVELQPASVVRGRVLAADGLALAGATVQRRRGGMADNPVFAMFGGGHQAHTDSFGRFELRGVTPGRLRLMANAPGHASSTSKVLDLAAGEALDGVEIQLGRGGDIEGRLILPAGSSPEDWQIMATMEPQLSLDMTYPDHDGRFWFAGLDPGSYQVQAMDLRAFERVNLEVRREFVPGQVPDIGALVRAVQDISTTVRARVRDDETTTVELDATEIGGDGAELVCEVLVGDTELDGGFVEVSSERDGFPTVRIAILEGNTLRLRGLSPGLVTLQLRAGFVMAPVGEPFAVEIPDSADVVRRTWRLPGGRLSGRVLDDETGEPVAGAVVRANARGAVEDRADTSFALSDHDGCFDFRGLGAGTYDVYADSLLMGSGGDRGGRLVGVTLAPGERRDDLVLRTLRGAGVAVVVRDAAGRPVARALVLAVDPDGTPIGSLPVALTNPDGRAWFAGLPAGPTRVVGRKAGLAPAATAVVDIQPDQQPEFELTLERGTDVTLRITDVDGSPLSGAAVAIRASGGPWIPTALLEPRRGRDGALHLGPLPEGRAEFHVQHPRASFTTQRSVPAGARATLVLHP